MTFCEARFADEAAAIAYLRDLHDSLSEQDDLSPGNPHVTALLSGFVSRLCAWQAEGFGAALPDSPALADLAEALPRLCAEAEGLMEAWWCRRLLEARDDAGSFIRSFWYYDNYRSLIEAEWALIGTAPFSRIVFLGSGALPLTALLLAQHTDCPILCIDREADACDLSNRLIKKAGRAGQIATRHGDAAEMTFRPDDCVLCASLLRGTSHYARLVEARAETVIVRDSEGVFRFCYRAAAPLPAPYARVRQTAPNPAHLNTSVLYRFGA